MGGGGGVGPHAADLDKFSLEGLCRRRRPRIGSNKGTPRRFRSEISVSILKETFPRVSLNPVTVPNHHPHRCLVFDSLLELQHG